jgi:hypothetical protein
MTTQSILELKLTLTVKILQDVVTTDPRDEYVAGIVT